MSDLKEFKARLDAGTSIVKARFEDRNETWAKDISEVERVRVDYDDTTLFLTKDEYKSLTREEKEAIHHAPSSPYP
jgi:hypothetical protein